MNEAEKHIYAFKTTTSFRASLEEIEHIIVKLGGKGFQYTKHPNGAQYVRFMIHDAGVGDVPMHVDIPQVYITTDRKKHLYLDKVGVRLTVLDLKVKLYKMGGKQKSPLSILAENVLTRSGKTLATYLAEGSNIAGLLPGE